jgi:PAS domain-containing protein
MSTIAPPAPSAARDPDLLNAILEALPIAVFLVDADLRLHRLNTAAAQSLGLDASAVIRERGGDALRCLNAQGAPHGCGSSEACKTCLVRRSTAGAVRTGKRVQQTTRFEIAGPAGTVELTLKVTAAPLPYDDRQYVLLALEDVTELLKLRGLIPRCAWCGRMRDDADYWRSVEEYLRTQHDVQVSHGICPECADKL